MMSESELSKAIIDTLLLHNVKQYVISPGSRNAPVIQAAVNNDSTQCTVVVDERSAAFVALGKSQVSGQPVALVCTSGTALLNYCPAVAEAYYQRVPLIIISADRPHRIINRNSPQTIYQNGVYDNFIKHSFNIAKTDIFRNIVLSVNDAINSSTRYPAGPVHINVEIDNPLIEMRDNTVNLPGNLFKVDLIEPSYNLDKETIGNIASRVSSPCKVLIIAGGYRTSAPLNKALSKLSSFGNFVVLSDSTANLNGSRILKAAETLITHSSSQLLQQLAPEVIITYGNAPLSNSLLKYLKTVKAAEHWHIGHSQLANDLLDMITLRIETKPEIFFSQLAGAIRRNNKSSQFYNDWKTNYDTAINLATDEIITAPWSDMRAMATILSMIPRDYNVQYSNGMSIRYGQMLPTCFHRVDCNRGVSGIEGSTSTAIGASTMANNPTILISGDMSAMYDLNALTLSCTPVRFKMIVLNNGGGSIFNIIESTRDYDRVDDYIAVKDNYNIEATAAANGYTVYHASDNTQLKHRMQALLNDNYSPSILIVHTDSHISAEIMHKFTKCNNRI